MKLTGMLRNLWFVPFFFFNTAVYGMLSLVVSLWSAKGARKFAWLWATTNVKVLGAQVCIEGAQYLPNDGGGVIIASNHRSAADIAAVLTGLPLDVCWVTKMQLLKIPFLGWHLKRVHIPVARGKGGNTDKFLQDGARKIQDGAAVVIFPEGTRNRTEEKLLPFRRGAFLLARAANRPIIPLAIVGSRDAWPLGSLFPVGGGRVTLRLGPPLNPSDYPGEDLQPMADATREAILRMLG